MYNNRIFDNSYIHDVYKLHKKSISTDDILGMTQIFMVSNNRGFTPEEKQLHGQLYSFKRMGFDNWKFSNWEKRNGYLKRVQTKSNIRNDELRKTINNFLKNDSDRFTVLTTLRPGANTPRYHSQYWDLYHENWQ